MGARMYVFFSIVVADRPSSPSRSQSSAACWTV
jgi:hypothetical protein